MIRLAGKVRPGTAWPMVWALVALLVLSQSAASAATVTNAWQAKIGSAGVN